MTGRTFCWLIIQEVKRHLMARWVGWATALLCACSAFSVALSTRDFQERTDSYVQLLDQRIEAQLRGTGRALGRAPEPALRVIRPPAPAAVLAAGIEPALPAAWEFTPAGAEALDPYVRRDFGIIDRNVSDLSGVIAGLGGLLALWLGVSTIVADRGAGRIAALRTLPVSPRITAFVHLAGGTLALTVVAVVWCVTVVLTLRTLAPADAGVPSAIPVSMTGPVVSYLALMFALGTAAGGAAREETGALVTAFAIWMAIVFVVPQMNQFITRSVADVPSRTQMEDERREHIADEARLLENEIGAAMVTEWSDVRRPNAEKQELAYFATGEPVWRAGITRLRSIAVLHEREWLAQRRHANRIRRWLDGLNPRWWLFESMAEIAGTGHSTEKDWTRAIDAHVQTLNQRLFDDRPKVNARVTWQGEPLLLSFDRHLAPLFSDLPPFVPPPAHTGMWTRGALRSLAGLLAYTLLAMAAAYFALRSRLR